jgi:hypothetical protein
MVAPSPLLRVGVVGGRERNELPLAKAARALGLELVFHDGKVAGTGSATLQRLAERTTALVILTDINSHRGVLTAKEAAKASQTPFVLVRRLSVSRLDELRGLIAERLRPAASSPRAA